VTHRPYQRTRQRIHKGMARHPGQRRSQADRLAQAAKDRGEAVEEQLTPRQKHKEQAKSATSGVKKPEMGLSKPPTPKKGFFKRLFQRKRI
jgi:hypothetical protein